MESTCRRRRPTWLAGLAVVAVVAGLATFRTVRSIKIQGVDLAVLAAWPRLRELVLDPWQVTPATLEALRLEKRVRIHVFHDYAWDRLDGELDVRRAMERARDFSARR